MDLIAAIGWAVLFRELWFRSAGADGCFEDGARVSANARRLSILGNQMAIENFEAIEDGLLVVAGSDLQP